MGARNFPICIIFASKSTTACSSTIGMQSTWLITFAALNAQQTGARAPRANVLLHTFNEISSMRSRNVCTMHLEASLRVCNDNNNNNKIVFIQRHHDKVIMLNDNNRVAACESRYAPMFVLNAIIPFNLCKFVVTRDTLWHSVRASTRTMECTSLPQNSTNVS